MQTPAIQPDEESQFRDKDADDAERHSTEHGDGESPRDELKSEKRRREGGAEGEPADKYLHSSHAAWTG